MSDLSEKAAELVGRALALDLLSEFSLDEARLADQLTPVLAQNPTGLTLPELVRAIPAVHLSEPVFNALASQGNAELNFLHIRHYHVTQRALQILAYSLTMNALVFVPQRDRILLRRPEEALPLTKEAPILTTIVAILYLLDNNIADWPLDWLPAYRSNSTVDRVLISEAASMSLGAKLFVWLHEVGHHVLGHLVIDPGRTEVLEQEADRFAIACLRAEENRQSAWQMVAAAEMALLLMSGVHPIVKGYPSAHFRSVVAGSLLREAFPDFSNVAEYILTPLRLALAIYYGYEPGRSRAIAIESLVPKLEEMEAFA